MTSDSSQSKGSIADNFGVMSYKDYLLWLSIENHKNPHHRDLNLKYDPTVGLYITKLDSEIFAENPITTPNIFEKEIPDREDQDPIEEIESFEIDTDSGINISDDWSNENYNYLFASIMDMARVHSFVILQLYNESPYWKLFTWKHIKEIKYNDYDQPIGCHIKYSEKRPLSNQYINHDFELTFEETFDEDGNLNPMAVFIPFGVGKESDLGCYDLLPIWTYIVQIRYCLLDIANNSLKTSGFLWAMYGDTIQPDEETNINRALDIASSSRGMGARESALKNLTMLSPNNPDFSITALDKFLKLLAGACRLPVSFFNSESEVANIFNSGASGDQLTINKKMNRLFGIFKTYFIKIIRLRWGILLDDIQPNIDLGVEESEQIEVEDRSQINNTEIKNEEFK